MITRSFLLILFVCSFVIAGQSSAGDKLVQIVVDNSGILHDERDPRGKSNFNTFLKTFFNNLARHYRRDRRSTTIRIISAIDPPLTIWSGFASDFSRTGIKSADVLGLVTDRPAGCNNLPAAIEEASINRELINAENNVLHIITSGVHSGPGCSELSQE